MENAAPAGDNDNVNKRCRVDDVEAETTFIKSALGLRNKLKEKTNNVSMKDRQERISFKSPKPKGALVGI